jgi:hypothetical protein
MLDFAWTGLMACVARIIFVCAVLEAPLGYLNRRPRSKPGQAEPERRDGADRYYL